jgi:hypothetical protein
MTKKFMKSIYLTIPDSEKYPPALIDSIVDEVLEKLRGGMALEPEEFAFDYDTTWDECDEEEN